MPWQETKPMDERMQFIALYETQEYAVAELCRHFEISRKTGYKWIHRWQAQGLTGLAELSRAPYHQAQATPPEIEAAILAVVAHQKHKRGPKKIRELLVRQQPTVHWPATSTIGAILKRHGLVTPRRRSRKSPPYSLPLSGCTQCNAVWSADFKGWFTARNGERCDPLTISDNHSRYLIRCQLVRSTSYELVRPVFESAFREYGLPRAIRTDNGGPFATSTVGGLSRLAVWWIRLGIRPERITPGKPQQNPRHERMHRTFKDDLCKPPAASWNRQQAACATFRQEFNEQRPHESLGQRFPAEVYVPSPRPYPLILPEMTYPDDMQVRWVKQQGDIWWKGRHVYLSDVLAGELVGLRQGAEDRWDIYFGPVRLAQLDPIARCLVHLPRSGRAPKRS